jgi:hypothetical protein
MGAGGTVGVFSKHTTRRTAERGDSITQSKVRKTTAMNKQQQQKAA